MAKQRVCDNCGCSIEEGGAGCSDGPPLRVRLQPPHNGIGTTAYAQVIVFSGSKEHADEHEGVRGVKVKLDMCMRCVCRAFAHEAKVNRWE